MQTNLDAEPVRIGALAAQTGCSVPTIRYYEEIGLIPHARRRSSGHRVYDSSAAQLIGFIRRCRDFGFTIEQVRSLASLSRNRRRDCAEARDIAQQHLNGVRKRMGELAALERTLAQFVEACNRNCVGGEAPDCSILKDLCATDSAPGERTGCCR
jgi:MerR family copper efflux transcriptional regulator